MKIKELRAVTLDIPTTPPTSKARRRNWSAGADRGLPINNYPDIPKTPGNEPGSISKAVWVQVTAEDGTSGVGECYFGSPVAALIDHYYAPLLVGRDCMALEYLL